MIKSCWLGLVFSFSCLVPQSAIAAVIDISPDVTFEVIDGGFGPDAVFDGKGEPDEVFPGNFDIALLGTLGEASQHAEFRLSNLFTSQDLTNLTGLASEVVNQAVFRVNVLPNEVGGLGSGGRTQSLAVRGYTGNGQPDAFDFQAGSILDSVSLSPEPIEETLDFDVTEFITQALDSRVEYAGFGVRAETLGGILLERNPRLVITTQESPPVQGVPEPSIVISILAVTAFGAGQIRRGRHIVR
jgi:hypothetical protein